MRDSVSREGRRRSLNRRRLVSILGVAAIGAVAACLLALDRRPEAEQLLEILAGKSVPEAAWAFAKLWDIGDEDLRVLAQHVDDARVTPLEETYEWQASAVGSSSKLALKDLSRKVLLSRTFASLLAEVDDLPRSSGAWPEDWHQQRWSECVESFLSTHKPPYHERVEPRPSKRSWLGGLGGKPPSYAVSFFVPASPGSTTRIVEALCGNDAARAIWFLETLRRMPDPALDGPVEHILSPARTKVRVFSCKNDQAGRSEGLALGRLIQLLLSERTGDAVLHYNAMRGAELELPDEAKLAATIQAAWRAHRATENAPR
jgi:hypothetical protein